MAANVSDAWLGDEGGRRLDAESPGERLVLNVELEVRERIEAPAIIVWLETREGARLFWTSSLQSCPPPEAFEAGERVHLRVRAENTLRAGRYFIGASLARGAPADDTVFYHPHAGDFTVTGDEHFGLLTLAHEVELERELEPAPR